MEIPIYHPNKSRGLELAAGRIQSNRMEGGNPPDKGRYVEVLKKDMKRN
jgi:hypothetical protein